MKRYTIQLVATYLEDRKSGKTDLCSHCFPTTIGNYSSISTDYMHTQLAFSGFFEIYAYYCSTGIGNTLISNTWSCTLYDVLIEKKSTAILELAKECIYILHFYPDLSC